jgi:DNA-binding LacI/PurR family transcriptional regulator
MSLLTSRTLEEVVPPSSPRRSRTIAVLSSGSSPYDTAAALSGIQSATRGSGYCVSIVSVGAPERAALAAAVERLRRLGVDGLLVVAPSRAAVELLAEIAGELPLVTVGAAEQDILPAVTSDHYAGAAAATGHLLGLGHRGVFHIAGPVDGPEPGSRVAGWRDTLLAAGAEVSDLMIGDGTAEAGYELGRRLGRLAEATAIFVAGDQMALGVLRALAEAGRPVPEQVSVVGFGGIPEGEFFNPPLTTIRQNFTEMGRRGAKLLQAEIELGCVGAFRETIPADLILRASTAAVA